MIELDEGTRRPPDGRSMGTASQAIHEILLGQGGSCSPAELRAALEANSHWRSKLEEPGFMARLIANLRHSRQIELEDGIIRMTIQSRRKIAPAAERSMGN